MSGDGKPNKTIDSQIHKRDGPMHTTGIITTVSRGNYAGRSTYLKGNEQKKTLRNNTVPKNPFPAMP